MKIAFLTRIKVALLAFLAGSSMALAGVGTGSGTTDPSDQYIENLKKQMQVEEVGSIQDLYKWCSRVVSVLKRERQKARTQLLYEKFAEAKKILKRAFISASQSFPDYEMGPMTKRIVDRGLIYVQAIEDRLGQNGGKISRRDLVTLVYFLSSYVDLIEEVATNLDRPYYIPYYYTHNRCRKGCKDFDFRTFSRRYVRYSREQIQYILNEFTQTAPVHGKLRVFPVGDPDAYLKLSELASHYVAKDLSGTLDAYKFSCVISDLKVLSDSLYQYLEQGDRTLYPNDRWAVGDVTYQLKDVHKRLGGSYLSTPPQGREKDVLAYNLSLYSGRTKILHLYEPRYVHKIEFLGEARYADANVDVYVKSQQSGEWEHIRTINLPQRDPYYSKHIRDTISAVKLKNVSNGKAVFKKVRLIYDSGLNNSTSYSSPSCR